MFSHILAGWDASPAANRAVDAATEIAHRFDARLTIIEVVPSVPHGGPDEAVRESERGRQAEHASAMIDRIRQRGVEATLHLAEGADKAQVLLDQGHQVGADLIVIGRGHDGGIARLFSAELAERLVRIAITPLLVVPDDGRE